MEGHPSHSKHGKNEGHHYRRLLIMTVLMFIAMYVLMYAMVDRFANVYANHNNFYMAALMTAAMLVIELLVMGGMYPNKKLNGLVIATSVVALAAFWIFIRQQTFISDEQFVKSMVPHHSGAILMCRQASLQDPQLSKLCDEIIVAQEKEIAEMKARLQQLD